MGRPNLSRERRREFVPALARVFADLGYRRTTTAVLAGACGVRENVLYRLWPDKRAMFVAALDHVYELSEEIWADLIAQADAGVSPAELILDYESTHHGEFGLYRIVFAGLSETDDDDIADALRRLYGRFHRFVSKQVKVHRGRGARTPSPAMIAWAIVGLGTVANIVRELDLMPERTRRKLVGEVGRALLGERR